MPPDNPRGSTDIGLVITLEGADQVKVDLSKLDQQTRSTSEKMATAVKVAAGSFAILTIGLRTAAAGAFLFGKANTEAGQRVRGAAIAAQGYSGVLAILTGAAALSTAAVTALAAAATAAAAIVGTVLLAAAAAAAATLAGLAAGLGGATKRAADFEQAMAAVSIASGATGKRLEDLEQSVFELSKETGKSTGELADALRNILGSGISDAAEAFTILRISARGAVGGLEETQNVASSLVSTIKAYTVSVAQAQEIQDVFQRTVDKGKLTLSEFNAGIGELLPFAAQAHASIQQLGAAIAAMTIGGVAASEAFTALTSLTSRVDEIAENAHKLGISFDKEAAKAGGLVTLLDEITRASKGNSDILRQLIPRREALLAVLSLTGPQEKIFLESLLQMASAAGAADDAFETMVKTTNTQGTILKANLNVALIELGQRALPAVNKAIETLLPFIPPIATLFAETVQKIAPLVVKLISGLGEIAIAVIRIGGEFEILAVKAETALTSTLKSIEVVKAAPALIASGQAAQIGKLFAAIATASDAAVDDARKRNESLIESLRTNVAKTVNLIKQTQIGALFPPSRTTVPAPKDPTDTTAKRLADAAAKAKLLADELSRAHLLGVAFNATAKEVGQALSEQGRIIQDEIVGPLERAPAFMRLGGGAGQTGIPEPSSDSTEKLRTQADLLREAANRAGELAQTFDSDVARAFGGVLSVGLEFAANLEDNVRMADALAAALSGVGQIILGLVGDSSKLGAALGGALSGAGAGAKFGVPGAIIGGAVGFIGGLFGGDDKEAAAREQKRVAELVKALDTLTQALISGPLTQATFDQLAALRSFREQRQAASAAGISDEEFVFGPGAKPGASGKVTPEIRELLKNGGWTDEAINNIRFAGDAIGGVDRAFDSLDDRLKQIQGTIDDWLTSNEFELHDIEDPKEQARILRERLSPEAQAAVGTVDFTDSASIEAGQRKVEDIIAHALDLNLSEEDIAELKEYGNTLDRIGDTAREAEKPLNKFQQDLQDQADIALLIGESAADSFADVQAIIEKDFPQLNDQVDDLIEIWRTGSVQQKRDALEYLKTLGLTDDEIKAIIGTVKDLADVQKDADDARKQEDLERRQASAERARQSRASSFSRSQISAPVSDTVRTQATVEAEPILERIAGILATMLQLHNDHVPKLDEIASNTGKSSRPLDFDRALGNAVDLEAPRVR